MKKILSIQLFILFFTLFISLPQIAHAQKTGVFTCNWIRNNRCVIDPSDVRANTCKPGTYKVFQCLTIQPNTQENCESISFTCPPPDPPPPPPGQMCEYEGAPSDLPAISEECQECPYLGLEGVWYKDPTCQIIPPPPTPPPPEDPPNLQCENSENSVNTAIGCIPYGDTNTFVTFLTTWGIGVGGGITFFLLTRAGYLFLTSKGNQEKIAQARQTAGAAISGIIFLILSIYIIRTLGNWLIGSELFQ